MPLPNRFDSREAWRGPHSARLSIIVDEVCDCILGAHFVGHAGQELVNHFGLAMRFGIIASRDYVYAYPTFSSDIKHLL
jgi:glutathione reductase (NADPH)